MVSAVVSTVLEREVFGDVVVHLNVPNFIYYVQDGTRALDRLVGSVAELQSAYPSTRMSLVLRGEARPSEHGVFDRLWRAAAEGRIPTVSTLEEAAVGVAAIKRYERRRNAFTTTRQE